MSSIFPLRESVSLEKREPRLVELDEDTADEVFEALSSGTTRQIFLELHEAPQTTSDLADAVDTSVQNAQYHLEKLQDVELVEIVDTWYSERGSEMKVFAPKDESLVLFAGRDKQHALRRLLDRVVGALGVLVPSSVLVGLAAQWHNATSSDAATGGEPTGDTDGGGADGADDAAGGDGADGGDGGDGDVTRQSDGGDGDVDVTDTGSDGDAPEDGGGADTADGGENFTDPEVDVVDNVSNVTDAVSDANESFDGSAEAVEAAASIDPLLAAGLFFVGGLFLFLAVTMWYGPGLGAGWE